MTTILINSLGGGGAERQVSLLLEKLNISRLILLHHQIHYTIPKHIEVISLSAKPMHGIIEVLKMPFYAWKLSRIITKDELVLSFLNRSNVINIISKLFRTHKSILSERIATSQEYKSGSKRLMRLLIKYLYPFSDGITVNSSGIKEDLVKLFSIEPELISVIYNAVDKNSLELLSREQIVNHYQKIFDHKKVIIHVGRFDKQKNHKGLIQAFYQVQKNIDDLALVLIGSGPLRESCEVRVKALGISDKVFFLGTQKNPMPFLKKATLCVLPSHYEGFPNIILESFCMGVPVLATDCLTGPRELLANYDDYRLPLKEFNFCDYGVLVSMDLDSKVASRRLAMVMEMLLLDNKRLDYYKHQGLDRVNSFLVEKIVLQWRTYLTQKGC